MKGLFKSILISLTLLVYGISVDSLLHSALVKNQVAYSQSEQVENAFTPSYADIFHLPTYNELVSQTSNSFQESEQTHLPQWGVISNSASDLNQQTNWRKELLRSRQINLSLTVKDIIFPFHSFT
ncbi:hypothetical protein ACV07N_10785 [Roseivirga echinicomitans]